MAPSTQTRSPEMDTTSVAPIEAGSQLSPSSADTLSPEPSSGDTLLKVFVALALLGIGSFFLVKPLVQALRDDLPLPLPRRTEASRQDFPLVTIPSSPRSPNSQAQTPTGLDSADGTTAAIPNDATEPLLPSPSPVAIDTRDPSAQQVRLVPPDARQPGVVEAPPSAPLPAVPPSAASASAVPASEPDADQRITLPNSTALRQTVRNLARSLPGQAQPSQPGPTVASSSQDVARSLPLPEEPYLPSLSPDSLNATGDRPNSISATPAPGPSIPLPIQPPANPVSPSQQPLVQQPPSQTPTIPQPTVILPPSQPATPPRLQPIPANPAQPIPQAPSQPTPSIPAIPSPQPATPIAPPPSIPSASRPPDATSPGGGANADESVAIAPPPARSPIPDEIALSGLNITGNTAFSVEDLIAEAQQALRPSVTENLDEEANPNENAQRPFEIPAIVSLAQLIQASDRITQLYVDEGYISSGAIIPEDGIEPDGTVNIQVIEGQLEAIEVTRSPNRQQSLLNHPLSLQSPLAALTEWLFPAIARPRLLVTGNRDLGLGYVRQRLARAGSAPLNINRLLAGVQLLQTDPLIETVSTEIQDGTATGTNILEVAVVEAPTTTASVTVDNSRSPSVGSIQQRASLTQGNFLGFGDRLALGASHTEGSDGWNVNYAIPINARNGTFGFAYSNSSSEVIEEPFTILDIQSESRSYEFTLRQPLLQTATEELALSLTASRRETQSEFLAGLQEEAEPFPSTGADANGETNISALRFAQDWTRQTQRQVFALRSEFSVGLNALGSTINPIRPDSRFFSWRGQGQWVRQIGSGNLFLLRGDIQLADGPLVPGEQFSLGGQNTLRGFRQDSLLTDNGWLASAEFRVPVLRVPKVDGVLQVAPFVEIGQGWNPKEPDPLSNTLASTGLGLLWRMGDRFSSRLDWGIPFLGDTSSGDSLQEDGFHFSVQFSPF